MTPRARARLLVLALAAGCGRAPPAVKLAVAGPMSGELGADGRSMERAVTLAVEEAQAAGGLPKVEVLSLDDRADPIEAPAAARRAVEDPAVFAVVGHFTSGCALEASRVYAPAGLAMITPSATAPELTLQQERADWKGARVVFRLPPSDAAQGAVGAEYAYKRLSLKRVAVLHDTTPYGESLASAFRDSFSRRGGAVPAFAGVARGRADFAPALKTALAGRPDGLFFGGTYPDAGPLLKQARAAGFRGVFLAGDGVKSPEFFEAAGPAADGAVITVSGVPVEALPGAADFLEHFQKRFSAAPRSYDLYAYEAARVALAALRKAGPDRAKVVEAVRSSTVRGMLGDVMFDAKGDPVKALVTVTRAEYARRRFNVEF